MLWITLGTPDMAGTMGKCVCYIIPRNPVNSSTKKGQFWASDISLRSLQAHRRSLTRKILCRSQETFAVQIPNVDRRAALEIICERHQVMTQASDLYGFLFPWNQSNHIG
jgi:hypothetical protein